MDAPRQEQTSSLPTSFAQQRLWVLDQLVPGNPFYNIFAALPLQLSNAVLLERALNEIVRRHDTLRTTFTAVDGQPMQVVAQALTVRVPVLDLRALTVDERAQHIRQLAQEEARRPFDLARGPLLRATLLRQDEGNSILLLTMHHIVSDGWSIGVFFRELTTLYQSFATGQRSPLPELAVQYADFAHWQREWLCGEVLKSQLAYWQTQLADLPVLQLPTDRPRPAEKTYSGARLPIALPAALSDQVRLLSQREGVTMFMTLLAAFQTLLHRYSAQDDIAVGSPIAGRNREEIEPLIGFFVNTLVLRSDLSGDPGFRTLLHRVRRVATDAYAHQDLPFEMLVEALQPSRDLSRNPLFQVIFQLLNAPTTAARVADSNGLVPLDIYSGTAKFDLELSLFDSPSGLTGFFEYSTDLYDAATVGRMGQHFQALLQSIVTDPDLPLSHLGMLAPGERERLLRQWNDTRRDYPRERCVHELFAEQAARSPQAVAIVDGTQSWTYCMLDRTANAISQRLAAAGAGPGSLVAVCMERSAAMVAALLAVLKSGAAYVPVDPAYPRSRIAFMLDDTQARVVVTQQRLLDRLPESDASLLCIEDGPLEDEAQRQARAPEPSLTGRDLAYVMYTSGSTGVPKGTRIQHRAINRLVLGTDYIALDPDDRVAHASSPSFDAATFEIWGALLGGARIVIVPHAVLLSPPDFAALLRRDGVTTLFVTTALFNQLASEDPGIFQPLRHLLVGGSSLDPKWVREVLRRGAPGRLLNVYGPTESTTFASWYRITEVPEGAVTIPIGQPIANTQVYVLDSHREPVPLGVAGELFVGGDGLAEGYHRCDELSAEKFVSHPFDTDPQARLYRTGDLVRRRSDGEIEFLGRIDDQIKLRGFRVELGEIEAALSAHPRVREACVVALPDAHGDKRLVAYLVTREVQLDSDTAFGLDREQVAHWREIFDGHVYRNFADSGDPTFNITGWNGSYDGRPIPEAEMREWLDDTVQCLVALKPRRVLEIGCGTGMLLFQIAPHSESYFGTDISAAALDYVRRVLAQPGRQLPQVQLAQRSADDFHGVEGCAYDLVIINSVVQYFPDERYLQRVIDGALHALCPGGHLFVGDVRSLPLLPLLHASVERFKSAAALTPTQARERIHTALAHETELAVAPAFFTTLGERVEDVSRVEVQPKRSRAHNELTRFRYQVVVHKGDNPKMLGAPQWIEWSGTRWNLIQLHEYLQRERPAMLGLARVANARLAGELAAMQAWTHEAEPPSDDPMREADALDPHDVAMLEDELPYRVLISWARHGQRGEFDVAFVRRDSARAPADVCFPSDAGSRRRGVPLTNNPLGREAARQLVPQLRAFLLERLPEFMVPALFVTLDALPLTPNGKVDRSALPAPDGSRPELDQPFVAPASEAERTLARIWAEVLGVQQVGAHDNFFELGGDSILSIQIIARAKQAGLQLTPQQIFQHQTIADLATVATPVVPTAPEQGLASGDVPLTPIQHWFFKQNRADPHHFNQCVMMPIDRETDTAILRRALTQLLHHHDALRLRFERRANGWHQWYGAPNAEAPFDEFDLRGQSAARRDGEMQRLVNRVHTGLDLVHGPLLRCALFRLDAPLGDRLLIVIHHLAVDGVSWRILLEDLQTVYTQLVQGHPPRLPDKTTSLQRWAQRLAQHASSSVALQELSFWLQGPMHALPLPVDHERGPNTVASTHDIEVRLSAQETKALLQEVPATFHSQVNDALLTALALTLVRFRGEPRLMFDLEAHGREEMFEGIDLSRTVGWFTSVFPVWLTVRPDAQASEAIQMVKEQLRRIPQRGFGFGVLRYLNNDASLRQRLAGIAGADVAFNYLGQFGETADTELSGAPWSPSGRRLYLLEINARVERGMLHVVWTYSDNHHRRETVLGLANNFIAVLRELINQSRRIERPAYTPGDFPNLKLNQAELDKLLGVTQSHEHIEDIYQLSPLQEVMLFQTLYAPGSGVYLEQVKFAFTGPIDAVALRRAWEHVTQTHSVLRTSFHWEDLQQPVQVVHRSVNLPWHERDLSGLRAPAREQALSGHIDEDRERGFDVTRAPLMRFAWFRLAPGDYCCIWTFHHAILDGWSVQTIIAQVSAAYAAIARGAPPAQTRAPQYSEYVQWLQRQDAQAAADFWHRHLQGIAAPTRLHIDRDAQAFFAPEDSFDEDHVVISALTTLRLKELCRRHHVTLNTVLQSAWALLLSRYSGEEDVLFGAVVSGRPAELPGVEQMVGMFINTLPVRVHVDETAALVDWLKALQAQQLEARRFEFSHLVQIQEVSDIPRGVPMFETVIVFQNFPVATSWEELKNLQKGAGLLARTNMPLSVMVFPASEILVKLQYNRRRFDAATVARVLGHLRTVLDAMAGGRLPVVDIPLLTAAERRQVVHEWNRTKRHVDTSPSLAEMFRARCALTPDAVALVCGREQLTYAELSRRANRLAHHLVTLGVGPEALVGICIPRSFDFVVALLAVFKAGGAYLPLDPSYPRQRLDFMLADAKVGIVLTLKRYEAQLAAAGRVLVQVDADAALLAEYSDTALPSRTGPHQLAYVIYTSGSTGQPKGVAVDHLQLLNRLHWMWRTYPFRSHEVSCQKTAANFVDSIWEFFGPLLKGNLTVIIPDDVLRDTDRLVDELAHQRITRIWLVPSLLRVILDLYPDLQNRLPALDFWVTSGEVLTPELFRRFRAQMPRAILYNLYGTSEIWDATWFDPTRETVADDHAPIGRPIDNVETYVLDARLNPVPIGVPGELYVGGMGLARGYLGRPAQTAEKFIAHPFSRHPGARLYRSGDIVRWLADGNLEFIGRRDHQVKMRGYRIELAEIEATLEEHPNTRQAVVLGLATADGTKRLVAYVVPSSRPGADAQELRRFLGARLPEPMMPAQFVTVEAIPLTPNGKINRSALSRIGADALQPERAVVAPHNAIEQTLLPIWSELLRTPPERISVDDHFFADLGGHSLLATQLVSRVRGTFEVELPLRSLFDSPTIAALAREIDALRSAAATARVPAIERVDRDKLRACMTGLTEPDLEHRPAGDQVRPRAGRSAT
jgi:amino acid adenylation domain-containing protein/non-ribosomal peptide synthase protein (TIGR01720 family)